MNNAEQGVQRLLHSLSRLLPRRTRHECRYCCETKLYTAFTPAKPLPHSCRIHLRQVCRACVRASLSAQLETRPLLKVGCSECSQVWDGDILRLLLGHKDKKRFKDLDLLAKGKAFVPDELPEEDTLGFLLVHGARLCPWCRFPFMKAGGCDFMSCESQVCLITASTLTNVPRCKMWQRLPAQVCSCPRGWAWPPCSECHG